jgi:hypothetical protein
MYTTTNYKTKKALREAVASGAQVTIYQPNDMFGNPKARADYTGNAFVEGPHYPAPHAWYAEVQVTNGIVTKVK